jgi:hypothetical protein
MNVAHTRRRWIVAATFVVAALLLLYAGRLVLLLIGATEGDVPPASSIPLPAGSTIVSESVECASGGCWTLATVRPPEGVTPEELSDRLGTTPQARLAGSFLDPRAISLSSEIHAEMLVVRADYWSRPWAP